MAKKRWWGAELRVLREDYEKRAEPLAKVAKRHRTSLGMIAKLAKKHKWPPRWPSRRNPSLPSLKLRRAFCMKKVIAYSKEHQMLDLKIKFLEGISSSPVGEEGRPDV